MALITTVTLQAETRSQTGKGVARQLRINGRVPAVIYGRGRESQSLSVSHHDMERTLASVSGTTIIDLAVAGATVKALIRDVQRHPFRPGIIHVDFYEIHEGETITIDIPIHLVGIPDGVRNGGGVLDQVVREIEIEVLPRHIPEYVELDVSALGIGQSLHVSDLRIENAHVLAEPERTVCTVVAPRVEEVEPGAEEAEGAEVEPELIRKAKEDGEEKED